MMMHSNKAGDLHRENPQQILLMIAAGYKISRVRVRRV
jgi:hypothetical protein